MDKAKYILILAIIFVVDCLLNLSYAQPPVGPPPAGSNGAEPPCWDPTCIPIDGGVSILIAAGAALGGKKIYDHYKKVKQD